MFNGIVPNSNLLLENPSLKLLRTIGSPLVEGEEAPAAGEESLELYNLAVKNRISMLYLETLQRQGKLSKLAAKYEEEKAKYLTFIDEVARVSRVLDDGGINFAIYKTIRPYPALLNDIDIITMDDDDMYKKAAEMLLRSHYNVGLPGIVDTESLTDDAAYQRAAKLATKPTSHKGAHISPTSTSFVAPGNNILIDLRKELAMNYTLWMDKNKFRDHIISTKLSNGEEIKTLRPELDLACIVAHSFTEHLYLLGDYYTFLFQLSKMGGSEIDQFASMVKENRITLAARVFTTITAGLCQAAYGVIPKALYVIGEKFGSDNNELKNMVRNNFNIPHRYKMLTLARFLLEKTREGRARKGILRQMLSMLNPMQAKLVIRLLIDKRRKEIY